MTTAEKHYKKMTETKVSKLVTMLGIPTIISMLITNIYNLVDTYFVGTLGKSQQAATGVLFTLQCIIQAIAFMLGHGSGTYVSKALADKDIKESSKYASTAYYVGGILGILLMVFGLIFLEPFMKMIGITNTILPYAKDYGLWVLISCPFMVWSLVLNNNLRYEGKAFYSMIGLCAGGVLNIFGDYLFVNVYHLGVFGAGMSTGISQIISFILLYIFYRKFAQSKISIKNISREWLVYLQIFKAGFPSLIRQGLTSISSGILNNLCKPFGDAAIAAMSVVNRFSSFIMCVGLGIGQGFQPVAAFNYQAKQYTRVKKAMIFTIVFGTILVSILGIFGIVIPEKIIYLFQHDPEVIDIGIFAMRMASIGVIALPLSVTANMLYQSIRKSGVASFLALLRSGLIFIPTLFILRYSFGLTGIQLAQPISDIISSLISIPFILHFIYKTPNTIQIDMEKAEEQA